MRWWLLGLALAGCKKGGIGTDPSADPDFHGVDVPTTDPDETMDGDLSTGTEIDLDWANSGDVACFPATENDNFEGPHVFFEIDKEDLDLIVIEVQPEDDVDVSIYTLEFAGEAQTPPNISGGPRCEASYADVTGSNPGQPEAIELQGFPDKVIVLGVSGPSSQNEGAFDIHIWREDANFDEE